MAMRLSKLFRAEQHKSELDEEIAAHLAMAAADKRDRGADAATAQQQAQREFGNTALIKDVMRETHGWLWVERLQQDLKYALRQMRKSPGFAASVIGTLALGIAAATAMFTVVDRVLLRPMPYKQPGRLVQIYEHGLGSIDTAWPTYPDIATWREQTHSFDEIAFYGFEKGRTFLGNKTSTIQITLTFSSGNLFQVLGVAPRLGPGPEERAGQLCRSRRSSHTVNQRRHMANVFQRGPEYHRQNRTDKRGAVYRRRRYASRLFLPFDIEIAAGLGSSFAN
jgi:hypothetical protein